MTPDDKRHGTNAGYRAGCRADCCRDGHAAYRRSVWRKRYVRGVDALYVDITGTMRRVRALQAMGWRFDDIAAEAGRGARGGRPAALKHTFSHHGERIHVDTAAAIAEVYERLSMTEGPSDVLRKRAKRWGWAPPLAWDNIDDPDEQPDGAGWKPRKLQDNNAAREHDEQVVNRILAGDFRLPATKSERTEVARRWPGSLSELQKHTGWKIERYFRHSEDGAA